MHQKSKGDANKTKSLNVEAEMNVTTLPPDLRMVMLISFGPRSLIANVNTPASGLTSSET